MVRTLFFLVLAAASGCAAELCRNGLFADNQEDLRPGRITGTGPVGLYQDSTPGCPQKGETCKKGEIASAGTEVLVSIANGGFVCVWQDRDRTGWAPAARVDTSLPFDRNPAAAAWAGEWKYFDNRIRIAAAGDGRLKVSGQAFWHGLNDTVHQGSIEGEGMPSGNHLALAMGQGDCKIRLTLVEHRLAASDSRNCGGANVTFTGIYEAAHEPFRAEGQSTVEYGRGAEGQETVNISNVTFELAQLTGERRLILRKMHSERNAIGDEGSEPKISVEAWPLGVNLKEKPRYRVELTGQEATTVDDALLVFDRTEEVPWWSVYHLDSGAHFFDTYAPLARFSITEPDQTERYAGLEIANDDTADGRLKARGVVGVLTYASGERTIREALITCDSADRAAVLHSLADTTFALSAAARTIRITLTPFGGPAAVLTVPVVNDDLDLAHARIPAGMHLAVWKR